MSLPTSYLTSTKHVPEILAAIRAAQAPKTFSSGFLQSLEFKSSYDRLVIGVLKSLGFLDAGGTPSQRYFDYLDQSQSGRVLAEGIREAYSDLFQINTLANQLSLTEIKNKLRTLSQGKLSNSVLDKMASTFKVLCKLADFEAPPKAKIIPPAEDDGSKESDAAATAEKDKSRRLSLGGLVYNIQIVLPESRDRAVYDALFRSLKDHLL
jgi:Family of unknown function (DUF5343)